MGARSRKRGRTARPAEPRERVPNAVKDARVREELPPLAPGERPGIVTAGAVLCAVSAVVLVVGVAIGRIGTGDNGDQLPGVIASVAILATAAVGMWKARYWAVLGFQALLLLNITVMFLLLLRASSLLGAAIALAVIVPGSWMFYKCVRAMARLQMPERPGAEPR